MAKERYGWDVSMLANSFGLLPINPHHNITHRHGPSKYNNEMLGVQSEFESLGVAFRASH